MKTQSAVCPHRWVIESPHGPISHARCRLCGEEKDFSNVASDDKKPPVVGKAKHESYKSSSWQLYRGLRPNSGLRI